MQIGNVKIEKPVIMAPMAGVSNGAFRRLCYEFGAGLLTCEMVSDKAIYYANQKTLKMLELDDDIHPVSLQIFGSDPQTMELAAIKLNENTNCDIVDINMGCPVTKVVKTGAGSALLKNEDLAVEIVKRVVSVSKKPVTVKMRLGYDHEHENYLSLAKKFEELGVSAIALHARTRSQMYEGKANWDKIKLLHETLKIPVIGNGDIKSLEDYIKYKDYCSAVMIGRGIVGNPFLIRQINDYELHQEIKEITAKDRFSSLIDHTSKLMKVYDEKTAIRQMRGLAPNYISGLYMATTYKQKMLKMETFDDLMNILDEYQKVLENNQNF